MQINVSEWGNSLGLRIPQSVAHLMKIHRGSRLSAELKDGTLILSPVTDMSTLKTIAKGINLKSMVSKITKKNRPLSDENDAPVGSEVW